jgi:FkbM family methyltransferase
MRKLLNLYRLNFRNAVKMPVYLLKRVVGSSPTAEESTLNDYYNELIKNRGFLKSEDQSAYASFFPQWNALVKTRKLPSSDLFVFRQIFEDVEYKAVVDTFTDYFGADKAINIIDAGANIGLTSLYLSRFFPKAKFICIEPDPDNFEILECNLRENHVKAEILCAGLWSRNSRLELVRDFRDKRDWSVRVQETDSARGLEAFSVNHLMAQYQLDSIDILKIDIEGSEKEIFTSENADVSFLARTKCIAIEIHDEFDCREEIYTILNQFGFTHFESGELTIGINQNLL